MNKSSRRQNRTTVDSSAAACIAARKRSYREKNLSAPELDSIHLAVYPFSYFLFDVRNSANLRPAGLQSFDSKIRHNTRGKYRKETGGPEKLWKIQPYYYPNGRDRGSIFRPWLEAASDLSPRTEQSWQSKVCSELQRRKERHFSNLLVVQKHKSFQPREPHRHWVSVRQTNVSSQPHEFWQRSGRQQQTFDSCANEFDGPRRDHLCG